MTAQTIQTSKATASYLRYGFVLGALGVIRALELGFAGHLFDSLWWLCTLCLLAIIVCGVTVRSASHYFPPTMVVFLSALAGGATTLAVSSIPGMAIGLFVGLATAFERTRQLSTWAVRYLALTVFPGVIVGLSIGFFGALSALIRVPRDQRNLVATLICVGLFVITLLVTKLLARRRTQQNGFHFAIAFLLVFLSSLIAVPFGIQFDTARRIRAVALLGLHVWSIELSRGPAADFQWRWPQEYLTRGFGDVVGLYPDDGVTAEQARYLAVFHDFESVHGGRRAAYRNREFATDGFRMLDLSKVAYLTVYNGRMDDAAMLAFRDSKNILHLDVQGSQLITDDGLKTLEEMESLAYLDLSGTSIDGSCLANLHPHVRFSHLLLANTQVTDSALLHLANYPTLTLLDLCGTPVAGASLAQLQVDDPISVGIGTLRLSHSAFEEQYLDSLPTAANLSLNGIPLSTLGMEKLICRYHTTGSMDFLSLVQTGISDEAARMLEHLDISELHIDATRLSAECCPAFVTVEKLELAYEMDEWLAADKSLQQLMEQYREILDTLKRLREQRSIVDPRVSPNPEISLTIRGLTVTREMANGLVSVRECRLIDATIEGHDLEQKDFDSNEMHRFFSEELLEDDVEATKNGRG